MSSRSFGTFFQVFGHSIPPQVCLCFFFFFFSFYNTTILLARTRWRIVGKRLQASNLFWAGGLLQNVVHRGSVHNVRRLMRRRYQLDSEGLSHTHTHLRCHVHQHSIPLYDVFFFFPYSRFKLPKSERLLARNRWNPRIQYTFVLFTSRLCSPFTVSLCECWDFDVLLVCYGRGTRLITAFPDMAPKRRFSLFSIICCTSLSERPRGARSTYLVLVADAG
ncbi:hypothetical protein GGR52DRAFT_419579 [Hypoxylon sp. FL1284]|nr:hypothetical protein GGR52DRAFT_419579 [Hypoxylon sp. FL1284]